MASTLDRLAADTVVDHDPIANLPVTAGMIAKEVDICDVRLRRLAAKRRKRPEDYQEREYLEQRKMALLLRIPR